jgi:uncharacterized protein (DUF1800 family)
MSIEQAIALNRFGFGTRPDERPPADPRQWLRRQIDAYDAKPSAVAALPDTTAIATQLATLRRTNDDTAFRKAEGALRRETYRNAVGARLSYAVETETPFAERLVHFWANHFAVSAEKGVVTPFVGSFEAEAIRPYVMGRFEDMLLAVEHHPAMIYFLDQTRSVGPDSPAAVRRAQRKGTRDIGLNENLAREILELHTLGVRSGYSQADVTEFARALTGWSINVGNDANPDRAPGSFLFRDNVHEPGPRRVMGQSYWQSGEMQARAIMRDLAAAPQTAKHIATKLARHFAGDEPPQTLIDKLAGAFTASKGDLPSVYRVLIDAPECWAARPVKFKSPFDWAISVLRGSGRKSFPKLQAATLLRELGQPLWEPGSPAGYDDTAARWAAPDALVRRVETAQRLAPVFPNRLDPRSLAPKLLVREPSDGTRVAIANADTYATAMTLLLVSPEFQRR